MRRLTREQVEQTFDELMDRLEEQGAFIVQIDGEDAAVFLPSSVYAELVERSSQPSGGDGRESGD